MGPPFRHLGGQGVAGRGSLLNSTFRARPFESSTKHTNGERSTASHVRAHNADSGFFGRLQGTAFTASNALQQMVDKSVTDSAPTVQSFLEAGQSTLERLPLPQWMQSAESREKRTALEEIKRQKAEILEKKEALAAINLLKFQADSNEAYQLLRQRAAAGSKPGQRQENFKLGLVVEGGGMRGACSGGALQALHDLGLRDCFDAVYGSSAGAINATYFLAGQRHGVDIYSEDISNAEFIDLKRLVSKKSETGSPALDLSFLLDYIMNVVKPLDWQAVVDSPIPLKVVASCLDTLAPVLLDNFTDVHDLRECLRASAAVPVVAGNPVKHRGKNLVDAAVFEAIPLRAAIQDGCTHCIVLPTRPPFKKGDFMGKIIDEAVSGLVKKAVLSPAYMKDAWAREIEYQRNYGVTPEELLVQSLEPKSHLLPGMQGCHVFPVFPGPQASYSPLCIDAATVMLGIAEGRSAALKVFGCMGVCPLPTPHPTKALSAAEGTAKQSVRKDKLLPKPVRVMKAS